MKKFIAFLICIVFCFSVFSVSFSADFSFSYEDCDFPQIFDMTSDEIIDFYANASYEDLVSPENAYISDEVFDGVPVKTYSIAFLVRDDINGLDDANLLMEKVLEDIYFHVFSKYFAVTAYNIYLSMLYAMTENGVDYYFIISLNLIESYGQTQKVIEDFVRPFLDSLPEDMTPVQKIYRINEYILNGQFSYDTDLMNRKSVYKMVFEDKKGVCEEYAGLSMLFFNELGLDNMIVIGFADGAPHAWNLVKIDGIWYNCDILWDGPIDASGEHSSVSTDYLLKSYASISSDHQVDLTTRPEYSEYILSADYDIDESLFNYTPKIVNPKVPSAPTVISLTADKVVLESIEGVEYSKDGVLWQTDNSFSGLAPDEKVMFYSRYALSDLYLPSEPSAPVSVYTGDSAFVFGDVDGDYKVTIADAMRGMRHISGHEGLSPESIVAVDFDENGIVSLTDIMKLFMYISGKNIAL